MSPTISPEVRLVAACCRWPPSPAREAAVREAIAAPIDWPRFERLVHQHRVGAIVRDGLRRAGVPVPPDVEERLASMASTATRRALMMAQENLRLQRRFDEAGIPVAFIKGASLGLLAYGDLGIKQSWDIDLLTTPDKAAEARRLLEDMGYGLAHPADLDDVRFAQHVRFGKECAMRNPDLPMVVELHWRLVSNRRVLPTLTAGSAGQSVMLAGAAIRTFEDDALFAYLCVHGTIDGWFRLKWLADVGAFITTRHGDDLDRLYRAAVALGAGRTPAVAILLCHELLGLSVPEPLLAELRAGRTTRWLASVSLRCATADRDDGRLAQYTPNDLRRSLSHLFILPGAGHFWSEVGHKWTSGDDQMNIPLPRPLHFLYPLMRLPLWAWRAISSRVRGLPAA